MTSDSTTPNLQSNSAASKAESISSLSDVEVDSTVTDVESDSAVSSGESNPILPDAEVDSVLDYLKSNSNPVNAELNSVTDTESDSNPANVELNSVTDTQSDSKELPNQKISNYFLWGGRLARPKSRAGKMPTPQDWIIDLLEIPNPTNVELNSVPDTESDSNPANVELNSVPDTESNSNPANVELNSVPDTESNSNPANVELNSVPDTESDSNPANVELNSVPDTESNSNPANVELNSVPDTESDSNPANVELNSVTDTESDSNPANVELNSVSDTESDSNPANVELNSVSDTESDSNPANVELNSVSDTESDSNPANVELNSVSDTESDPDFLDLIDLDESPLENTVNKNIQVRLKREDGRLLLILPTESQVPASESNWVEIWQQLKVRLNASDRFKRANTPVHLIAGDRLLDGKKLQEIAETFSELQMQLKSVSTSRRQTAIAAATAGYSVEQIKRQNIFASETDAANAPLAEALYLEMTVRSGVEIRHPGSVIILGDVNPGGIVVADGDILVWGRLRGIAHAGVGGNRECLIMSLQMEPTQLRIADAVARAPEKSPMQFYPEVAYITSEGIRIARAIDFSKTLITRMNQEL